MRGTHTRMAARLVAAVALLGGGMLAFPDAGRAVVNASCDTPDIDGAGPGGIISGTDESEVILGTDGNDLILGLGGDDTICGSGGVDLIAAGDGDDDVWGDGGNDFIDGGAGDDYLVGGLNDDLVVGGEDDDECAGYDDAVKSDVEETNRVTCEDVSNLWLDEQYEAEEPVDPVD